MDREFAAWQAAVLVSELAQEKGTNVSLFEKKEGAGTLPDGMYEVYLDKAPILIDNPFYKPAIAEGAPGYDPKAEYDEPWREKQIEWTFRVREGDEKAKTIRRWTSIATGDNSMNAQTVAALEGTDSTSASKKLKSGDYDEAAAVGKPAQIVVQGGKIRMMMATKKKAPDAKEIAELSLDATVSDAGADLDDKADIPF